MPTLQMRKWGSKKCRQAATLGLKSRTLFPKALIQQEMNLCRALWLKKGFHVCLTWSSHQFWIIYKKDYFFLWRCKRLIFEGSNSGGWQPWPPSLCIDLYTAAHPQPPLGSLQWLEQHTWDCWGPLSATGLATPPPPLSPQAQTGRVLFTLGIWCIFFAASELNVLFSWFQDTCPGISCNGLIAQPLGYRNLESLGPQH